MAPPPPISILGYGVVTAAGARPEVADAAARAGLARMTILPENADPDDDEAATNVARLSSLSIEEPVPRRAALLGLVIRQALSDTQTIDLPPLGAWLVGGLAADRDTLEQALEKRFRRDYLAVEICGPGGCAGLLAIERATQALLRGDIELALVAGAGLHAGDAELEESLKTGRTIGPGRSWGYVPGEGAAALLLTSDRALRRLRLPVRAMLRGVASAVEPNPHGGPAPCTGTGLTEAVRRALGTLPAGTRVDQVFCDLNGERGRTDEWGFTVPRVTNALVDPSVFVAPASIWGDCGAANGLILLALAARAGARAAVAQEVLVWSSSDGVERAAALVSAPAPAPASTRVAAPDWAETVDNEVLAEMAEECGFRWGQRHFLLVDAVEGEPPEDWGAVVRAEEVTDTLAMGLADCGAPAWEIVAAAVDPGSAATVYTAVRVLLHAGQFDRAIAVLQACLPDEPALELPAWEAFEHRGASPTAPQEVLTLIDAGPAFALLAVRVAALNRLPLALPTLEGLVGAAAPARAREFARAFAESGNGETRPVLAPWLASPDPELRAEATLADLLLAGKTARESVLKRAEADPSLLLPAALVADAQRAPALLASAKHAGSHEAILAAGLLGHASAVPWLLSRLDDEEAASAAAVSLELLLGTPAFEDAPAEPDGATPARHPKRVSRSRALWSPIADRVLRGHAASARLRAGVAATAAGALGLLDRPHLPERARRCLIGEVVLRGGVPRVVSPTTLCRVQQAWITSSAAAASREPGGWDLPPRAK